MRAVGAKRKTAAEGEAGAKGKDAAAKRGVGEQFAAIGRLWAGFVQFVRSHPWLAGGLAAVLGLVYGNQAFNNYFYTDKEVMVNNAGSFYAYGDVGRFGMILVKKLLGLSWYNPYLAGALLLIALWLAGMAGAYLFYSLDKRLKAAPLGIFMLLFLVYPTYVEQFLFQYQAFEVALGILLLIVADWHLMLALKERNWLAFLLSLPPVVICFGIYQSMVPIQLCLYLGCFLMLLYGEEAEGRKRNVFALIGWMILHFLIAFVVYEVIAKLFFTHIDYLTNQVLWKNTEPKVVLMYIKGYIRDVVMAEGIYYTPAYDICWIAGLAAMAVLFLRRKWRSVWYGLGLLGVVLSPFFLTFIIGRFQFPRVQLTLPLACGVLWLFGSHVVALELKNLWRKAAVALVTIAGCAAIFMNVMPMMRLFYTRDVIGKADEMTAVMLIGDLDEVTAIYQKKPVIFIGHRQALINASCYEEEVSSTYVVLSAFGIEYMFEPAYYYSTHRLLGFFRTLGFSFRGPTTEMMPSALEDSKDMAVWPLEGSIREFDDYVIVKLSSPEYDISAP